MSDLNVKVAFLNFDASTDLGGDIKSQFEESALEHVVFCSDYKQAGTLLNELDGAIFIFMVETRSDFIEGMTVLKSNQKLFSKGVFRAICITDVTSSKVLNLLNRYNCNEILPVNTTVKTLNLKIAIWRKSIDVSLTSSGDDRMELSRRDADYQELAYGVNKREVTEESILLYDLSDHDISDDDFSDDDLNENDLNEDDFSEIDDAFEDPQHDKLIQAIKEDEKKLSDYIATSGNKLDINLESGDLKVELVSRDESNNVNLDVKCRFESFFEDEIEVEIPRDFSIAASALVEVSVMFIYNRCRVELILDGVVLDSEATDDTGNIVTVKLNNKETDKLDHFMALFQERQKSVSEFLALAKGH